MAAIVMTLSVLEGHFSIASFFNRDFLYLCIYVASCLLRPTREQSIVMSVSVCLSVPTHISWTTCALFTNFSVHVTCGRVCRLFLLRRCVILYAFSPFLMTSLADNWSNIDWRLFCYKYHPLRNTNASILSYTVIADLSTYQDFTSRIITRENVANFYRNGSRSCC